MLFPPLSLPAAAQRLRSGVCGARLQLWAERCRMCPASHCPPPTPVFPSPFPWPLDKPLFNPLSRNTLLNSGTVVTPSHPTNGSPSASSCPSFRRPSFPMCFSRGTCSGATASMTCREFLHWRQRMQYFKDDIIPRGQPARRVGGGMGCAGTAGFRTPIKPCAPPSAVARLELVSCAVGREAVVVGRATDLHQR